MPDTKFQDNYRKCPKCHEEIMKEYYRQHEASCRGKSSNFGNGFIDLSNRFINTH